mmetsp:Transcript_20107/g.30112  ORF Transcript_20107/g.30112 Transcript_20107/m.30112 type:complete len:162 (+) Transcript_20107:256-741(+)
MIVTVSAMNFWRVRGEVVSEKPFGSVDRPTDTCHFQKKCILMITTHGFIDRRYFAKFCTCQPTSSKAIRFSYLVAKIMFSNGDSKTPLRESVDLMKEMITGFVRDLIQEAIKVSPNDTVKFAHLRYVLRKDHPKLYRAKEKYTEYKSFEEKRRKTKRAVPF